MTTATHHSAKDALQSHLRLIADRRIEEWLDLFADDGAIEFPYRPPGVPARVQGRDALRAHMTDFADSVELTFVEVVFHDTTDRQVAVAEFGTTGHVRANGRPYEQRCIGVVRTDSDGRIVLFKDYWNPLVAMQAFAPEPG